LAPPSAGREALASNQTQRGDSATAAREDVRVSTEKLLEPRCIPTIA
jgi:hypothetical protein